MKPTILSGAEAGTGQTYQDPRDRIAARGKPTKPIPQAKPKPKKRETYIIEIEDGGSKYEVEWTSENPPNRQDIQNLIGRTRQAEGRIEGVYQDRGTVDGNYQGEGSIVMGLPMNGPLRPVPQSRPEEQMRLERNPNPGLMDYIGYGVQALKEGFGEQVRGDLETAAELDKMVGKPLADTRKFVGDVAGTIVDPYMKGKPADQFSEGRALSKGIQSLDPTQMLSAAKPALGAKGGGKGSQPLMNSVMAWIANPVPGTVKFLSGVDDETVQKAIAGDVGAMESLVGGAFTFASNFVGAKTAKDVFASGNPKRIRNALDKASKVVVSRGDESVNGLGAIKTAKPMKGAPLPDKAKGMGWREPSDVDPIVSFIRGESPNVTSVTDDMPGAKVAAEAPASLLTPAQRQAIYKLRDMPDALQDFIDKMEPNMADPAVAEAVALAKKTMGKDAFAKSRGQDDNLESLLQQSIDMLKGRKAQDPGTASPTGDGVAVPEPVAPVAGPKEPWQMTREEHASARQSHYEWGNKDEAISNEMAGLPRMIKAATETGDQERLTFLKQLQSDLKSKRAKLDAEYPGVRKRTTGAGLKWIEDHRPTVERALKEGKPVPTEVLSDYPDLAAKYKDPLAPDAHMGVRGGGDPDFYTVTEQKPSTSGGGAKPPSDPPSTAQGASGPDFDIDGLGKGVKGPKGFMHYAKEASYIARGLKLGADVGALLRQGSEMAVNDPVQWVKSAGKAFTKTDKAKLTKYYAELESRTIRGKGMADVRKSAGLKTSSMDTEEAFASKLFDKVPGLNRLENFQKAFLDSGRIERFDSFYRKFPDASEKELKQYAAYLNSAMGKSNVSRVPELLEVLMTSPRWTASRWEMAGRIVRTPEKWLRGALGNKAAKQEARNLGRYALALYGILEYAESKGAEVEFNPRSSDFLKLRIGGKVFDPTSGVAMPIRTALRLMLYARGEDAGYGTSGGMELAKTALNTANPVITTPWGLITQKSLTGFDIDEEEKGAMMLLPLIANGAMESWEKDGPVSAMIQTGTELVGINSGRYPKSKKWTPRKGEGTKVQQLMDKIPLGSP